MLINSFAPSFQGSYREIVTPKKITAGVKLSSDKLRPLLQAKAKKLHNKDTLTLELFTDSMRIKWK